MPDESEPGLLLLGGVLFVLFFAVTWRALDDDTETGPYLAFAGVLLTGSVGLIIAGW